MMKVNLQKIQYFLRVAKTLNFTKAAKELYVSQPALSKQIRKLEKSIGVQLFKRSTKQVELTEGGKIMFQAWSNIMRETEEAIARAKAANSKYRYKIRIGLLEMGGIIDSLMPLLENYTDERDGVEIEYSAYGFSELKERLKNKELDLIFSFSSEIAKEHANISFKTLKDLDLNIIVPKKNHFYNRDSLEVKELKNETIYVFSNSYSDEAKKSIIEHCQREGFYPAKLKVFPNITSMAVALTTGNGITIGYKVFFREVEEKLKFFPIRKEIGKHYIVVAWRDQQKEGIKELLDYLGNKI